MDSMNIIKEYDEVIDKVTGKRAIVVYVSGPGSYMIEPRLNLIGVRKVSYEKSDTKILKIIMMKMTTFIERDMIQ